MRGNPGDDPELCPFAEEPALHCDHPGPEACSDSGEQEGSGDGGQKEQDGEEVYVSGGEVERHEAAGSWGKNGSPIKSGMTRVGGKAWIPVFTGMALRWRGGFPLSRE